MGLVIASLINQPVVSISQRQSHTCFPLFFGLDLSQGTGPLVIAHVDAHYIFLTLDRDSPLPYIHPQWRFYRVPVAAEWETLYQHRLMNH